jgi:hypothetical protein
MLTGSSQRACRAAPVVAGVVAWLALLAPRTARAESALGPVDLSYRAPATCPELSAFLAEVSRSTERLRLAKPGEKARRFEVVIADSGRTGRLVVEGGEQGERAVTGADCAEVSRVLAFAVALAADPDAHATTSDDTSSVAAFPTTAPTPAASPVSEPEFAAPPRRDRPPAEFPASRRPPPAATSASLGGFVLQKGGGAPGAAFGAGGFGEVGLHALPLAPRLRLGVGNTGKTVDSDPGQVKFSNTFANFELCAGSKLGRLTLLLPCFRGLAGTRTAAGIHGVPNQRSETRAFLELGASAHLRRRFGGFWFLELGCALLFPTVRDRVLIAPSQFVYRVPAVAGLTEIALGFEFGDQNAD